MFRKSHHPGDLTAKDLGVLKALAKRTPILWCIRDSGTRTPTGLKRFSIPLGSPLQKPPAVLVRALVVTIVGWLIEKKVTVPRLLVTIFAFRMGCLI